MNRRIVVAWASYPFPPRRPDRNGQPLRPSPRSDEVVVMISHLFIDRPIFAAVLSMGHEVSPGSSIAPGPTRPGSTSTCRLRLRSILVTSSAFILGVVPLVIAWGAGAEMRQSLDNAVFGGMLGVTLFEIFLTPVF